MKNNKLRKNTSYALLTSLFFVLSCKPVSESDVKGVDAVTSGDANKGEDGNCGAFIDDPKEGPTTDPKQAVKRVFAAMPESLQNFYGGKDNALKTVRLVKASEIEGVCAKLVDNDKDLIARAKAVGSCFDKELIDGKNQWRPLVVIVDDPTIISGSLLSNYVFIAMKTGAESITKVDMPADIKPGVEAFSTNRLNLANGVINDLNGIMAGDVSVIKALAGVFNKGDEKTLKSSTEFQNFLIAEFAESHYCSKESNNRLYHLTLPNRKEWSGITSSSFEAIFRDFGPARHSCEAITSANQCNDSAKLVNLQCKWNSKESIGHFCVPK